MHVWHWLKKLNCYDTANTAKLQITTTAAKGNPLDFRMDPESAHDMWCFRHSLNRG